MIVKMRRKIPIETFSVKMTLYENSKEREELLPLLQAIQDAEDYDESIEDYFMEHIFPNNPRRFIQNILEELRLLDLYSDGELTEKGIKTLETGIVMIPKEGPYIIEAINDPLIQQTIISYRPLRPDIREELRSNERNYEKIEKLPNYIHESLEEDIKTFNKDRKIINIKEIDEKGSYIRKREFLDLLLEYDESYWKLSVVYDKKSIKIEKPEDFNSEKIVDELLIKISSHPDLVRLRIPDKPENLSKEALISFKKNYILNNRDILTLGNFNHISVEEVPLFPENKQASYEWAKELFIFQLSSYMTQTRLIKEWEILLDKNEPLNEFEVPIPKLKEIRGLIDFSNKKFWYLQAPLDFKLSEVVEE